MIRGLLVILLLPGWTLCGRPPIRTITGAYIKQVQNVVVYENAIPLIYNYRIPVLPQRETLVNSKMLGDNCKAANTSTCAARAAIISHLEETEKTLHTLTEALIANSPDRIIEDSSSDETNFRGRRSAFGFVGEALGYCCDLTTKQDIADLEDNNDAVESFMQTMKDSIIQEHQYLLKVHNTSEKETKFVQEEISKLRKWAQDVTTTLRQQTSNAVHQKETDDETHLINLVTSAIIAQMQYWSSNVMRISSILHACQNQLLSPAAVSPSQLQADLLSTQQSLRVHNRHLSITPDSIRRYFRLKLTSCMVTDTTITIQVQIPVTQDPSRKVYELKRVPFLWRNTTCHLRMDSTLITVGETTAIITGNDLHHCIPSSGLCRIPAYHTDMLHGSACPYKLLSQATIEELSVNCIIQCAPLQATVVTQVDLHKYVISGFPKTTTINCKNASFPLEPPVTGSLEIDLSCDCSIDVPGQGKLSAPFPCPGSLSRTTNIVQIIPVAWALTTSQRISVHTQHLSNMYENLSDVLNQNWTMELPSINLTIPEHILAANRKIPKLIHHSALVLPSMSFLWNLLLSVAVIWLLYQHNVSLPFMLTLSTLFQRTNAEADLHIALEQLGTTLMIAVLINGFVILIVIIAALYLLCRNLTAKRETNAFLSSLSDEESPARPDDHTSSTYVKAFDPASELPPPTHAKREKRRPRGNNQATRDN